MGFVLKYFLTFSQKVEALNGKRIKKVCLGDNFSIFLTNRGQVLACGISTMTGLPDEMAKLFRPFQVSRLITYLHLPTLKESCNKIRYSTNLDIS